MLLVVVHGLLQICFKDFNDSLKESLPLFLFTYLAAY